MRVLVAEDESVSRRALTSVLNRASHEVIVTVDGLEAWDVLQRPDAPRVAVLDWMMPKLDGVEVIRRVRALPGERTAYLILLSGRDDTSDVVTGLEAGADDYLAKPFDAGELLARVRVGQRMVEMQDRLAEFGDRMQTLAEERARQLVHADRLATLGSLAAGIAHEINNPVAFVAGNAQTLERAWAAAADPLARAAESEPTLRFLWTEVPGILAGVRKGVERITKITRGLKSFARQDTLGIRAFSLDKAVESALELCHNLLKHGVVVEQSKAEGLREAMGDRTSIEQVLVNLITNAADAMAGRPHAVLRIDLAMDEAVGRVTVSDNGPGFTPEALDHLFDPFFTTKPMGKGTGLGLSICRGIIESHHGEIVAGNAPEGGATVSFTVPLAPRDAAVLAEEACA